MKQNPGALLLVVAVAIAAAAVTVKFMSRPMTVSADNQPAFARVMKTRTLRCAYFTWQPFFMKDPSTASYSGINYDEITQIARILKLKLVVTEEIPLSQLGQHLQSGRSDTLCPTVWPSGSLAGTLDFTDATDFLGAYAMVRADDKRFDGDLSKLNDPNVTIAVIEAGYPEDIANEEFPKAKQYALGMDSDGSQLLLSVATGKADVTFVDPFLMQAFDKANPGKVRRVANVPPARVFGDSFVVAKGETKLRDMLNMAIRQMNQSGFFDRVLDKYLKNVGGDYYYPAKPYVPAQTGPTN
jgi:ABC-type amino acid transport substrate-binding protein